MFKYPLIRQLGKRTTESFSMCLQIVCPSASGGDQVHGDERSDLQPMFCKLLQPPPEGAQHRRM